MTEKTQVEYGSNHNVTKASICIIESKTINIHNQQLTAHTWYYLKWSIFSSRHKYIECIKHFQTLFFLHLFFSFFWSWIHSSGKCICCKTLFSFSTNWKLDTFYNDFIDSIKHCNLRFNISDFQIWILSNWNRPCCAAYATASNLRIYQSIHRFINTFWSFLVWRSCAKIKQIHRAIEGFPKCLRFHLLLTSIWDKQQKHALLHCASNQNIFKKAQCYQQQYAIFLLIDAVLRRFC